MNIERQQLTLFVQQMDAENIEKVRSMFNPQQSKLIKSHVTLCREHELNNLEAVLQNLSTLRQQPVTINFGSVIRFDNDKGLLLPATTGNDDFQELRKKILKGLVTNITHPSPHITLMHPRNSTCTNESFETMKKVPMPAMLTFNTIALIEQVDGGSWRTLKEFELMG